MAKRVDLTPFLGNNKKHSASAAVGTVKVSAIKEAGVESGDTVVLTKVPANAVITGVTLVVKEAATGTSVSLNVNGATVAFSLATAGVTNAASFAPTLTKDVVEITGVATLGATNVGEGCVVVNFTPLDTFEGMFVG